MRRHSIKSFVRLALLIGAILFQQDARGDVFTEYLTGRQIYAIVADSGHIWFGTLGTGLASFDGNRFTEYNTGNSRLRDDFIWSLAVDHDGNLWLGTDIKGVGRFNREENTWVFYDTLNGLVNNRVRSIAVDGIGRLWFGTDVGVGLYNGRHWYRYTTTDYAQWDSDSLKWDTIKKYNENEKHLSNNLVHAIAADSSGSLWFGTEDGVSMLKGENEWHNLLNGHRVSAIGVDRLSNKWFGTNRIMGNSFHKLGAADLSLVPKSVDITCFSRKSITSRTDIYVITNDYEGNLWLGTNYGPLSFDPISMNWRCSSGSTDLDRKTVRSIAADVDGNLWFGSRNPPGATKYTANWTTFSTATGDSLENDEIFSMARDLLNQVWIGTKRGIARFDSGAWHPKGYFPVITDVRNKITAIEVANDTTLWLGAFGGGIIRINVDASKIDSFTVERTDSGLVSDEILSIAIAGESLWFGTTSGLSLFHFQCDTIAWDTTFTTANGLCSNEIEALAVDLQGNLWCGTPRGVGFYDGTWKCFTTENTANGLGNDNINSITIDTASGRVWFGTDGGGASFFMNGRWGKIAIDDGLVDNFVKDILIFNERDEIWFATGGGVSCVYRLGKQGEHWTSYMTINGLADNHITTILAGTKKGEIWFGTRADGVTRYRRQGKQPNTFILPSPEISAQPEFDFRVTTQPEFELRFFGIDLNTPKEQLRYSYKLDNDSWSQYTFDTFARITATTSGLHTFYVKAIDKDKNEDRSPATLCFYKTDPDTGISTSCIDTSGIHISGQVKIILYWPPYQSSDTLKVTIVPVHPDSLKTSALFAYDLMPFNTNILKKGVILSFEFPDSVGAPNEQFSIHRDLDSLGRVDGAVIGGTQTINQGRITLTTAIDQFGRYAVRAAGTVSGQQNQFAEAKVSAQPRIFSPHGGGHGPQTTLSFQLKHDAHVKVRVYNLAGRLVDTIWDGMLNAGVNAIAWDGRDRDQQICPTGLYILLIDSNVFKANQKVMVLNE